MLQHIKRFFEQHLAPDGDEAQRDPEHALRLATAALLIEMTRMDHEVLAQERAAVVDAVREHFGLEQAEADELIALADEERAEAADYHQFTSLINRTYPLEQKVKVIELLWRVAYADEELNKYEEHLVRKIAELLYVPHTAFIAAKHRVRPHG